MSDQAEAVVEEAAPAPEPAAAPNEAPPPSALGDQAPASETPEAGDGAQAELTWPDDWGTRLARGDDDKAKRLGRYASPEAVADALIEAQDKIRSGGLKTPFPTEGTDEQKSAWRKENGIPTAVDEYKIELQDGMVIGEEHKPVVDGFLEGAVGNNFTQEQVNYALSYQVALEQQQRQQQDEADSLAMKEAQNALMQEWGGSYNANLSEIKNHLVAQFGEDLAETLDQARLPNGQRLGDNPDFVRSLLRNARDLNPGATIVPGSSDPAKTVESEIAEIKNIMTNEPERYWKDNAMQQRLGELREWQKKQQEGR